MSLIVARLVALSIGIFALVGRVLVTFWVEPLTWRIELKALGFTVGLIALLGTPLVLSLLCLWILSPLRHPPASLVVDTASSRFIAPNSPYYASLQSVLLMWIAGGLVLAERVPDGDHMRIADFPAAVPISVAAMTLFTAFAATLLFLRLPSVILNRDGLTIRVLGRSINIGWDELAPGGPPPPAKRRFMPITLYRKPAGPGVFPRADKLPNGQVHVDPGFLTAVIRHYVERPERRNAIGTQAELDWLRTTLALPSTKAAPTVPTQ